MYVSIHTQIIIYMKTLKVVKVYMFVYIGMELTDKFNWGMYM